MSRSDPSAWSVYVHVPWCRIRCPYCAFVVVPERGAPPFDAFVDAVVAEHTRRRHGFPAPPPRTVYLGGGTPSRLPLGPMGRLLRSLGAPQAQEVTVEANPEDVDDAWLDGLVASGVHRISLGVQTLQPAQARSLGRTRTARAADAALRATARSGLASWSADLMFGLHGQSLSDLDRDLDALLDHAPPHVSLYGLTIEAGTGYARGAATGRIRPADEDLWREMYAHIHARLTDAGLERYEISNYARPGHRSLHNQGYWTDRPYLGLGPGAHGYAPDGLRWVNTASLDTYLTTDDPTAESEHPDPEDRAADLLVAGLRGLDGLSVDHLAATTGHVPDPAVVRQLTRAGLLTPGDGDRMTLTDEGVFVADGVVRALVRGLRPALAPTPSTR